jgi:predicted AAA+ superfamily ATPase
VLLGCLQPGQTTAVYADALGRLADRLHYLNSSGDKAADSTRFWFDTRANLRREMEDRKQRFDAKTAVRQRIEEVVKKLFTSVPPFDGVHVFTPHSDVPDDSALRLVVLPPENSFLKEDPRRATDSALEYLRTRGTKQRHRANRLIFIAADDLVLNRLRDVTRVALAWASIVEDVEEGKLNIDQLQRKQAEREYQTANSVLPRAARECFRWLLCPVLDEPTATKPKVESFSLNTTSGNVSEEVQGICRENALVIETWSPIHLRDELKRLYWKDGKTAVEAMTFWEDSLKYLYLPRLRNRSSLSNAIRSGAATKDFFGTAYGQRGETYEGFRFGDGNVQFDDTLLLIEPAAANQYEQRHKTPDIEGGSGTGGQIEGTGTGGVGGTTGTGGHAGGSGTGTGTGSGGGGTAARAKVFH